MEEPTMLETSRKGRTLLWVALGLLVALVLAAVGYLLFLKPVGQFPLFAKFDPVVKEVTFNPYEEADPSMSQGMPEEYKRQLEAMEYRVTLYAFKQDKDVLLPVMEKQFLAKDGWKKESYGSGPGQDDFATYSNLDLTKAASMGYPEGEYAVLCGPKTAETIREFAKKLDKIPPGKTYLIYLSMGRTTEAKIRDTIRGGSDAGGGIGVR